MAPLEELERAFRPDTGATGASGGSSTSSCAPTAGRPTPLTVRRRAVGARGRRADRVEARGPPPHRRAQAQQLPGPGPPRAADGEVAASSRRPAPASTASRPPRPRPGWVCRAASTWDRSTWRVRLRTSSGCVCSAPRSRRWSRARRRSRTRSTRRCGTGRRTSRTTHYVLGSVLGPHPYPTIVREFQSVDRPRGALRNSAGSPAAIRTPPSRAWAAARMRSASFPPFSRAARSSTASRREGAAGRRGEHSARFSGEGGTPGVLQGTLTVLLQDEAGQILPTHSVAAGLDYPAVGPEHAYLKDLGRVEYPAVADREALEAFEAALGDGGDRAGLESAHAVAFAMRLARRSLPRTWILVSLSGRGDKDLEEYARVRRASNDPPGGGVRGGAPRGAARLSSPT